MARKPGLFGGLFGASCALDVSLLDDLPALIAQLEAPQPDKPLVETRDSRGYTLLHHAAKNGNVKAADILLGKGADANATAQHQVTPVHLAAGNSHLECLHALLDYGGSHECKDDEGKTPLDYAQQGGHNLCVHLLSKYSAHVEESYEGSLCKLMDELEIVMEKDPLLSSYDMVITQNMLSTGLSGMGNDEIINKKYHINCHTELASRIPDAISNKLKVLTECSLLHIACYFGKPQVVQYLLSNYPEMLYSQSIEGYTPLHVAVIHDQQSAVDILISKLSKIVSINFSSSVSMALNEDQALPPQWKRQQSSTSLPPIAVRVIDVVNAVTCTGHTVLHLAAILNHLTVLDCLLSLGDPLQLDIEAKDMVEFTPLHAATYAKSTEAVAFLLQCNANPNTCSGMTSYTDVFKTPLAQACALHHQDIFNTLLQSGATDQDLFAVKWCLSCCQNDRTSEEIFVKLLATFIKRDELSRVAKLHRRESGLSVSKAASVDWSNIPLNIIEVSWLKLALQHSQHFSASKGDTLLQNVTSLVLSNCLLTALPLELFQLPELVSLNVSNNKITDIPAAEVDCELLENSGWTCNTLAKLDISNNKLAKIPEFLFDLPNLKSLDVSSNCLTTVSIRLWITPQLCEFCCAHNKITVIPSDWKECLEKVAQDVPVQSFRARISRHQLPRGLSGSLPSLVSSNAKFSIISEDSENYSGTPPVNIKSSHGYLYNTESDSDSDDKDETGSSCDFSSHTTLQNRMIITSSSGLVVDWEKETDMDDKSMFLMTLDFSHNQLTTIPPDLACLAPKLVRLNLSHNELTSVFFPKGFPADLKHLNLSHNPLALVNSENSLTAALPCTNPHTPQTDWNYTALCQHRSHSQLLKLQFLDLSNCNLSAVNFYTPLQSQKELHDKIRTYSRMPKAKQLEQVPLLAAISSSAKKFDEIEPLAKLVFPLLSRLLLKHNNLRAVPDSVCDMVALSSLDLSYNPIIELDKEMGQLCNLWEFPLEGLQLISPPQNILARGKTKDIVGFLASLLKRSQPYHRMKLMLVGRSARGKTTLLNKITEKGITSTMPHWGEENHPPSKKGDAPVTVGIAVSNWTYVSRQAAKGKVKRITFKTWDFAGQEDYYATHQYFLSQRSLYLAVWNVTHGREGVEELKSWLLNIQARAPCSPVIVVGTHVDRITDRNLLLENMRLVKTMYGDKDHHLEGYPPIMASVAVSNVAATGIKDLREKIFTVASELKEMSGHRYTNITYMPTTSARLLMDQLVPASYLQLEDTVRKIAHQYHINQKPPVLSAQEFRREVFKDPNVRISKDINDKELEQAVRFLHDNGTMLHYEDTVLNDFYFVDPQWLCDLLAHIVTVRQINPFVVDGIMMLKDLTQIFRSKEFPIRWQKEYLHLLTRFEVAIQLDNESILIPSFLPEKPPTLPKTMIPPEVVCLPPIRNFLMTTFVPVGFWSRLMSRLFADSGIILLAKEGCGITKSNEATSPTLNWIKSRCSLELQYGNLTLFRLAEVKDRYFSDPNVTHVSIFKSDTFHKRLNEGFCGISLEVMDIYPVIKHAEKKFSERLAAAASDKKGPQHYEEVPGDRFNHLLTTDNPLATLQDDNHGTTTVEVHNTVVKTQNDNKVQNGDSTQNGVEAQNGDDTKPRFEVTYPRKKLKSHNYDVIDVSAFKGQDYTIYEALDLAPFKTHGPSMTTSFACDTQAVEALDLDKHLRHPSMNSMSSANTYKQSSTRSSSQTGAALNDVRVPFRPSFSMDASSSPNFCFRRTSSRAQSGSQTTGSSFKSNDLLTTSYRSQRSTSTFAFRSRRSARPSTKPKPLKSIGIDEAAHDRMRAGLVTKVMEHITILVSEWFSGIKPQLLIPCPYCVDSKPHTTQDHPIHLQRSYGSPAILMGLNLPVKNGGNDPNVTNEFVFNFDDCVWISRTSSVVYCPAHGDIPLKYFAPDVMFSSLGDNMIIRRDQITVLELLGEGTYAKVFKVTLTQDNAPTSVEIKTAAMKSFTKKEWTSVDEVMDESAVSEALTEPSIPVDQSKTKSSVSVVFPKRPLISLGRMADAHQNMRNELSVLSQLQHENIISLLGVVVTPPSILIEYAPMGTVKQMYEAYQQSSQRLSPCVSQITIVQIASGIEFLHKRSIVYRDLKGDNVLVWRFPTPNNSPLVATNNEVLIKLSDYGISQFASINGLLGFAGTPGFIAPEIIKYHGKEVYSNKVDIFSLGMVIYELITLHPPYDKFNQQQANQAIESGVRPSLSKKDLNSLILQRELMIWCWQQDPDMRPTATQVVEVARSEQFCRLVDGIRIDNDGRALCMCHREIPITLRQRARDLRKRNATSGFIELSASFSKRDRSISVPLNEREGHGVGDDHQDFEQFYGSMLQPPESTADDLSYGSSTLERKVDFILKHEIWVASSDVHCSRVTVLDYCGRFTGVQDISVGSSPILSICLVHGMVWMGSEVGYLYIYDANTRLPMAQAWLEDKFPILSILHVKETRLVYIALENGSVYAVRDDISVEMSVAGVQPAVINLNVLAKHKKFNTISACLTAVPTGESTFEIWVGQKGRRISVLTAEDLKTIASLQVTNDTSRVSHYVAHLTVANLVCHSAMMPQGAVVGGSDATRNGGGLWEDRKSVSVFAALYHGQFITQWDVGTRENIDILNCSDYVKDNPGDVPHISSLHIVDMDLFVGLLNGKLLMVDLMTLSPIAVFHCHEDRVKPIFSLQVTSGNAWNWQHKKYHLMSCGSGFRSYFKTAGGGEDSSVQRRPSHLLVWDIDRL